LAGNLKAPFQHGEGHDEVHVGHGLDGAEQAVDAHEHLGGGVLLEPCWMPVGHAAQVVPGRDIRSPTFHFRHLRFRTAPTAGCYCLVGGTQRTIDFGTIRLRTRLPDR